MVRVTLAPRHYKSPSGWTWRGLDGHVVTFAKPHWPWARIVAGGRIHRVQDVIVRWNHWGGTRDRPVLCFTFLCGQRQTRRVYRAEEPDKDTWCRRCRTIEVMREHDKEEEA